MFLIPEEIVVAIGLIGGLILVSISLGLNVYTSNKLDENLSVEEVKSVGKYPMIAGLCVIVVAIIAILSVFFVYAYNYKWFTHSEFDNSRPIAIFTFIGVVVFILAISFSGISAYKASVGNLDEAKNYSEISAITCSGIIIAIIAVMLTGYLQQKANAIVYSVPKKEVDEFINDISRPPPESEISHLFVERQLKQQKVDTLKNKYETKKAQWEVASKQALADNTDVVSATRADKLAKEMNSIKQEIHLATKELQLVSPALVDSEPIPIVKTISEMASSEIGRVEASKTKIESLKKKIDDSLAIIANPKTSRSDIVKMQTDIVQFRNDLNAESRNLAGDIAQYTENVAIKQGRALISKADSISNAVNNKIDEALAKYNVAATAESVGLKKDVLNLELKKLVDEYQKNPHQDIKEYIRQNLIFITSGDETGTEILKMAKSDPNLVPFVTEIIAEAARGNRPTYDEDVFAEAEQAYNDYKASIPSSAQAEILKAGVLSSLQQAVANSPNARNAFRKAYTEYQSLSPEQRAKLVEKNPNISILEDNERQAFTAFENAKQSGLVNMTSFFAPSTPQSSSRVYFGGTGGSPSVFAPVLATPTQARSVPATPTSTSTGMRSPGWSPISPPSESTPTRGSPLLTSRQPTGTPPPVGTRSPSNPLGL